MPRECFLSLSVEESASVQIRSVSVQSFSPFRGVVTVSDFCVLLSIVGTCHACAELTCEEDRARRVERGAGSKRHAAPPHALLSPPHDTAQPPPHPICVHVTTALTPLHCSTATDHIIENIDSLREKFGDASPRRSSIKGHTLKKLTKGGSNLENLEVTLANEALAKGRARCRRPYADLRPDSFEGSTRTELLVYNDARAMYEAKVCFVKELPTCLLVPTTYYLLLTTYYL